MPIVRLDMFPKYIVIHKKIHEKLWNTVPSTVVLFHNMGRNKNFILYNCLNCGQLALDKNGRVCFDCLLDIPSKAIAYYFYIGNPNKNNIWGLNHTGKREFHDVWGNQSVDKCDLTYLLHIITLCKTKYPEIYLKEII